MITEDRVVMFDRKLLTEGGTRELSYVLDAFLTLDPSGDDISVYTYKNGAGHYRPEHFTYVSPHTTVQSS